MPHPSNVAFFQSTAWGAWATSAHHKQCVLFVLMQHLSSRKGNSDKNKSLWCGWAVLGAGRRFWFAGDTGYCGAFKEIGQQYGPFDLSAIPIGAYEPRWFMKSQHIDPDEAVQIHQVRHMARTVVSWIDQCLRCQHFDVLILSLMQTINTNTLTRLTLTILHLALCEAWAVALCKGSATCNT